jgi:hypothetical protein
MKHQLFEQVSMEEEEFKENVIDQSKAMLNYKRRQFPIWNGRVSYLSPASGSNCAENLILQSSNRGVLQDGWILAIERFLIGLGYFATDRGSIRKWSA